MFIDQIGEELEEVIRNGLGDPDFVEDVRALYDIYSGYGIFIPLGFTTLAAAGAAIAAIFALRGSNGGRVTLCILMGLFAAWKLCSGTGTFFYGAALDQLVDEPEVRATGFDFPTALMYGQATVDLLLMALAIMIMVMLLVGSANRYFSRRA